MQSGSQQVGRPSIGSWMSYGLGSPNKNLPSFIVFVSSRGKAEPQNINMQAWSNGFLPSSSRVRFRSGIDPVLYLSNPKGMIRKVEDES